MVSVFGRHVGNVSIMGVARLKLISMCHAIKHVCQGGTWLMSNGVTCLMYLYGCQQTELRPLSSLTR